MKYLLIIGLTCISIDSFSQKMTKEQYVSQYFKLAVQEMNTYRIPASITLAQGILETESGNSDLCKKAKNHFGVKCQTSWTGMKFIKDDDTKNECFRAYTSDEESYRDHSTFLLRSRYEKLFTFEMTDYRSWAYGLKEAGYATNPNYPQLLIKYIEDLKLYQFDNYGNETSVGQTLSKESIDKSVTTIVSPEEMESRMKANKEKANNLDSFNINQISAQRNISIKNLLQYNELENEQMPTLGQNFFLQPKLNSNAKGIHEVKWGQSIYDISQMYGMTISAIRKLNKLENWQQPQVGEFIFLNTPRENYTKTRTFLDVAKEKLITASLSNKSIIQTNPAVPSANFNQSNSNISLERKWINYIVLPKETLFKISKNFDCSPSDILSWNNLTVEQGLSVGQSLKINTLYPNGLNTPAIQVPEPIVEPKVTMPKIIKKPEIVKPIAAPIRTERRIVGQNPTDSLKSKSGITIE
jgi:LysM repeat protein